MRRRAVRSLGVTPEFHHVPEGYEAADADKRPGRRHGLFDLIGTIERPWQPDVVAAINAVNLAFLLVVNPVRSDSKRWMQPRSIAALPYSSQFGREQGNEPVHVRFVPSQEIAEVEVVTHLGISKKTVVNKTSPF